MRKILIIAIILIFSKISGANNSVSPSEAQLYASKFMESYLGIQFKGYNVQPFTLEDAKSHFAYVVNFEPEGWVIIASDNRVVPIIAYSPISFFQLEGLSELPFYFWFKAYHEEVELASKLKVEDVHPHWEQQPKVAKETAVEPFMTTKWDQNRGWNAYCPEDEAGPGGRVYAGCVAVAMGQAMFVYKHPTQGLGSKSYGTSYGNLSANFGETEYQWHLMHNTQANEHSALLLYHLGVSVSMNYSASGSGAFSNSVPGALRTYFDFSNDVTTLSKNNYTNEAWEEILTNELVNGRPIYYSGNSGTGQAGHAFNIDGADGVGRFHFNWGWSGSYDGYYYLSSLRPGSNNFSVGQQAVVNIRPRNHWPTDITLTNQKVDENQPAGTVVGLVTVADETPGDSHTFEVNGVENIFGGVTSVPFEVMDGKLVTTKVLDFNEIDSYEIVITATDAAGQYFTKSFFIEVNKVETTTSTEINFFGDISFTINQNTLTYSFSNELLGSYNVIITDVLGRIVHTSTFVKDSDWVSESISFPPIFSNSIYIINFNFPGKKVYRTKLFLGN